MGNNLENWNQHFIQWRPYLISIVFRITGSLSESEEIVQDAIIACATTPLNEIQSPKAWLTKICANKALNHLKSAYQRRERYPGVWLPDQVPECLQVWQSLTDEPSQERKIILSESLTTAFLLLLEKLTPEERVVYLLKEIFEYPFDEISRLLDKNESTCRKIAQRAREAIARDQVKFSSPPPEAEKILARFFSLAKSGDTQELLKMFSADSQLWGDGGGKVRAAGFVQGLAKIAGFYKAWTSSEIYNPDLYKVEFHRVNSRPGIVISKKLPTGLWTFDTILSFEFEGGQIIRIYGQRNPNKLGILGSAFFER